MAYLHEKALSDATKRLYMLGSSSRSNEGEDEFEATGTAIGAGIAGLASRQKSKLENDKKRAIMGSAIEQAKKARDQQRAEKLGERQDIDYIRTGTDNPFEQAKVYMGVNRSAKDAPIGGQYTRPGFKKMIDQAELDAEDINYVRGLMGTGEVY